MHADNDDEMLAALAASKRYVERLTVRVLTHALQPPLLPETLSTGVYDITVRRSLPCLQHFVRETADLQPWCASTASEMEEGGSLHNISCKIVVSETSLVHYTKKAKPAPQGKSSHKQQGSGKQKTESLQSGGKLDHHEDTNLATNGVKETASGDSEQPVIDEKYWKRRYNYFSRFDEGIRMDAGAWFEVTPESVAVHIADRLQGKVVVDGTCGVGGNAIQLALTCPHVIGVDLDNNRLLDAAHNARIYGVHDRIDFVCDDFIHFAQSYSGRNVDVVFLSPPWGGPVHLDAECFALKDIDCPDIVALFAAATMLSKHVVLYLPRHVDVHEMALLAASRNYSVIEVEKVLFQYPTPHLKLCIIHFAPVTAMQQMPVPKSSYKKVGQQPQRAAYLGPEKEKAASSDCLAATRRSAAPLQGGAQKAARGHSSLMFLPPLVGPLMRCLYCRYHYIGRYIIQALLQLEKSAASGRNRSRASLKGATGPARSSDDVTR
eukprot:CAMPEP_0178416542 /NCGR_PEP_ID=MMETSP0689_2-20121128/24117_1 /TAXON_ID=160604 /ORGANISM="Amphidinium massartii, Strain CS-259" /LENGTH=491 /DNA_ID=CAMNT_0020037889 /DNA_START=235 /DNA_END=1706 /DNA_ORIENTATION=+